MRKTLIIPFVMLSMSGMALAVDQPTVENGQKLFASGKLGKSGKSCASCHAGGKNLEWAATYDDDKLAGIINQCIRKPLQGKPLASDSTEMKSLILYIKTFAGPGR